MKPKTGFESGTSPTFSENGAPIQTGRGLEDTKRRIMEAFEQARNASPTPPPTTPVTPVTPATPQVYSEHHEYRFHKHVEKLTEVALRSNQLPPQRVRHDGHRWYLVEVPVERVSELIEQAVRRLSK